jgi:2-haloacid dehalogenase
VVRDSAALANTWRNAYMRTMGRQVAEGLPFRPLKALQREDLTMLLAKHFPQALDDAELDEMTATWRQLDPWPDSVAGLLALKQRAIIAPLSNGNFDDMILLARHAGLPWDAIVGSSLARVYKPHPDVYLRSVAAMNLEPAQVCMVAAHQADLHHAASHGLQTAFVTRPLEFGGATRPVVLVAGVDYSAAAEVHADGDWTFIATDLLDLAAQHAGL